MTVANTGPEGYRTLARLRAAALKADAGDLPGALALWDQVSADEAADPQLRNIANLLWVQHEVDHGDPAAVQGRLAPLIAPGNPWRPMALESQAWLLLRTGETDKARDVLRQLTGDPMAPPGVRSRAGYLLQGLGEPPPAPGQRSGEDRRMKLTRRAALLALPLGLGGCSWFDNMFSDNKPPLPGKREAVLAARRGLEIDPNEKSQVVVPPAGADARVAAGRRHADPCRRQHRRLRAATGLEGRYRRGRRLPRQDHRAARRGRRPRVHHGQRRHGRRLRRASPARGNGAPTRRASTTAAPISAAASPSIGGTVYATTGRGRGAGLDAATGKINWRKADQLAGALRRRPSSDGKLLLHHARRPAAGAQCRGRHARLGLSGHHEQPPPCWPARRRRWPAGSSWPGSARATWSPCAPTAATLAWSDSLAAARGRNSLLDLSAIRGLPVIDRRAGLRDRRSAACSSASTCAPAAACGSASSAAARRPGSPATGCTSCSTDQALAALTADDGRVRWVSDLPRWDDPEKQKDPIFWSGPVLAGGKLVLVEHQRQGRSRSTR